MLCGNATVVDSFTDPQETLNYWTSKLVSLVLWGSPCVHGWTGPYHPPYVFDLDVDFNFDAASPLNQC